MSVFSWSQTAASNASADATINWSEGQSPSSVNDSARAMMAALAKYRDDISGAIVTSGTSTAYTVASNSSFDTLAHLNGQIVAFTPHTTNDATVTLDVDSLGAKPLRPAPSVELQSGMLIQGTPYAAIYNNSDSVFYLFGVGTSPGIPLGAGMDFWGSSTPSSAFAFPTGQAISRTTYAGLFALVGTTYGTGDGSTTFNLPDKTERVSVMKASIASRLTSTYFGGDSTALGATGGGESKTLATANLPAYTPSGSVSISSISVSYPVRAPNSGSAVLTAMSLAANTGTDEGSLSATFAGGTASFTGSGQGGSSSPFRTVQPTIVCNYIIRVL